MLILLAVLACTDQKAVAETPAPAKAAPAAAPAPVDVLALKGPRPKNVLMLSIDTLRKDHVSRYAKGASTPFLDRFLSQGLALDNHRSCSNWTLAAVICAMSGQDHVALEFLPEVTVGTPQPAPPRIDFIDEILARHGFYTGRLTSNVFLGADYGVGNPEDLVLEKRGKADGMTTEGLAMIDRAIASGKPWFVQVHYLDPHAPYYKHPERHPAEGSFDAYASNPKKIPKATWAGWTDQQKKDIQDATRARYAGEVEFVDQQLDVLWQALERKHVLDDTLVVLWTDHGEQFWERGKVSHGYDLHAEESDGVAGFWAKGLKPKAFTGETVHEDIVPTLLTLMGFEADIAKEKMTGLPVGKGARDRATFTDDFSGQNTKMSIDQNGKRLIYNWEGKLQYYVLASDPHETNDKLSGLARTDPTNPSFPADAGALWALLAPRVKALDAIYSGITPVPPGKDPTPEQLSAPRDLRQRGPDEIAQAGGTGSRGKAGGSGTRRRSN